MEAVNDLAQAAVDMLGYLLPFLVAAFSAGLVKVVLGFWNEFKRNAPEFVVDIVDFAVEMGRGAAEQRAKAGIILFSERLDHAVDVADAYLRSLGYNVSDEVLRSGIEAAIHRARENFGLVNVVDAIEG